MREHPKGSLSPVANPINRIGFTMSNLSVFVDELGVELVIDTDTGEAFATQAGYCRMSGISKSTISTRMKGVQENIIRSAEILTAGGVQGVRLIPAKLVYRWMRKDNPELADEMGEVGSTVYLYKRAGYEITSTAIAPRTPQTYIEALEELLKSEKAKLLLQVQNDELEHSLQATRNDNDNHKVNLTPHSPTPAAPAS